MIVANVGSNTIGGMTAGSGNTIGFSTSAGVSISGSSATQNVLEGNFIGTNAAGTNLGNGLGVVIDQSSANTVGGTATGAGNTIAFNGSDANHGALTVNGLNGSPDVGTGNAILNNLFYGNTGTSIASSGIDLTNGGNHSAFLPAPVIANVSASGSGATTITVNVSGVIPGTYLLDVFASARGALRSAARSPPSCRWRPSRCLDRLRTDLADRDDHEGIERRPAGHSDVDGHADGLRELDRGDTSEFAATAAVPQPFVVKTTATTGAGSLAYELAAVNGDTANPNPDTIQFQLSTGDPNYNPSTNIWTISLDAQSGLLPTITHAVILDATTQPGYSGTPVVEIDGAALSGDGLTLGTSTSPISTSSGSIIRGLIIVGFGGPGIDVETNNNLIQFNVIGANGNANDRGVVISGSANTIGGTAAGAGNVIAHNTNAAVDASSGSDNTIRGNLIYSDGQAIVPSPGENPPVLAAAISIGGTTTIEGSVGNIPPIGTILDFYANPGLQPPTSIYLGSYVVTTSASNFTASLPISVPTGATITATATSPAGNTSALSSNVAVVNPLAVTNTNDDGVGSLRQAMEAANQNGGLATIVFALPAGTTFNHPAGQSAADAHQPRRDGRHRPGIRLRSSGRGDRWPGALGDAGRTGPRPWVR